ncbi:SRPBCC family protein [Anditalea andensis]|uniref:Polyketide cyclase n=1 Tax=Anditalea andensis TaxID=1048983 RepID=A0A074L1F2_9BACT|nr:SRPBCC family protein [Anditalea andensis]KEO74325.1 hypothetical protein EL17_09365 [Anditalea andensis]
MTSSKKTRNQKRNPEITIAVTINSQIENAFNYIAPINLMHIFRGNAMIPAIIDTSVKQGWNQAGLQRTVYFGDGSTSRETLLTVDSPTSFSYKNEHFTSKILSSLLKRLEGEWLFIDLENGSTKIEWTYRTIPTNFFARLFVKLVLIKAVHAMLRDAMEIIRHDLETGELEAGTTW